MHEHSIPRLVLVTRRSTARVPLPELAKLAIAGGVDVVQIREPGLEHAALAMLIDVTLDAIRDPARLMVNRQQELAAAFGIGLHLPESIASTQGRPAAFSGLVSRAVHRGTEVDPAAGFDFAIAGHTYATHSKPDLPPLGIDGLRDVVSRSPIPVIAIGGIAPERVGEVLGAGARGVAVMSTINDAHDPSEVAARYRMELDKVNTTDAQPEVPITVNGKPSTAPDGISVQAFLEARGHHERMVVVELNGTILRRHVFAEATISTGDVIEIVHFVGGG